MNFDFWLFQVINNLAGHWPALDWLGVFLAEYLQYAVGAGLLIFWFWKKEDRMKNLWAAGAALGAVVLSRLVLTEVIRWLWLRPRPFVDHTVKSLVEHEATGSFPSGHAALFFALAAAVYFFGQKRAGWWLFGAAVFISLARVLVGVHYPLDIMAGALVGFFSGWLVIKLLDFYKNKKAR